MKTIISRTGVYGVAFRGGKLLVVQQQKGPHKGKLDLPGGGIEPGESIEESLKREFLEEVGMGFTSMHLLENRTATTEGIKECSTVYLLHQIGLIYRVEGLFELKDENSNLPFFWLDPQEIDPLKAAPFLESCIKKSRRDLGYFLNRATIST